MRNNQSGFTLIELTIVLGILLILFGFITMNFVGVQNSTTLNAAVDVLVSDMSSQQTKAMLGTGASVGTSGNDYGVHFQADRYILFTQDAYNPNDSKNFTVEMDPGISISDTLNQKEIIFKSITGTVSGYLTNQDSVTITDSNNGKSKTIKVNRYGVVIGEN